MLNCCIPIPRFLRPDLTNLHSSDAKQSIKLSSLLRHNTRHKWCNPSVMGYQKEKDKVPKLWALTLRARSESSIRSNPPLTYLKTCDLQSGELSIQRAPCYVYSFLTLCGFEIGTWLITRRLPAKAAPNGYACIHHRFQAG